MNKFLVSLLETVVTTMVAFLLVFLLIFLIVEIFVPAPERNNSGEFYINSKLHELSRDKMDDLIKTGHWSHDNSNGCDFNCRINKFFWGVDVHVGENLYDGECDLQNAFRMWNDSPTHKAILDMDYNYSIILMEPKEDGRCYVVMNVVKY